MAATGTNAPTPRGGKLQQPQLHIVGYILRSLPSDIMVFFTCNACGQSIKKAQVEKHYLTQCRRCEVLSCMDCGKDFVGDDYKTHTKCISENEKYGGKDYTAKPNKGEVKQSQWIECIQAVSSSQSVSPRVKNFIQRLANFDNIPRKKEKFKRFVKNSLKVWDDGLVEEIWTVFSEAGKKPQANVKESVGGDDSSQEQKITASISKNGEASSGQPAKHSKKAGKDDSDNHIQDASRNENEGGENTLDNTSCSNGVNERGDDKKPAKKKKKKKKDNVDVEIKSDEERPVRKEVFSSEDGGQKDFETPKHKKKRKRKEKCLGDEINAVGGSSKDDSVDDEPRKKKKKKLEGAKDTEGRVGVKDEEKKNVDSVQRNIGLGNGELPKKKKKKKHKDVNVDEVLNAAKRPIDELSCSTEDVSHGENESPRRKKKRKRENKDQQSCDGEASTQGPKELGGKNSGVEHGDEPGLIKKKKCKKRHADVHTSNGVHTGDEKDNTTAAKDKHKHSKKSKSEKRVSKEECLKHGDHEDKRHKKKTHKGGTEKMKSSDSSDGLLGVVTKKKRKNKSQKSDDQKDEVSRSTVAESEVSDGLLGVVESKKKAKRQKRKPKDTSTDVSKLGSGKMSGK